MSKDFRLFLKYVWPSMTAMIIAGSYSIIDTIFIGRGMGELGLAAIAVTWPLIMILWGLGDLIGSGAAVLLAQSRGAKDFAKSQKVFGNMFAMQLIFALPISLAIIIFLEPILRVFGANDIMMPYAYVYSEILIYGAIVSMFSMGIIAIVRNDGHPMLAMWLVILGLLGNIFLDWLFIIHWRWEAAGAAWATVISQAVSSAAAILFFFTKHTKLRFRLKNMKPDFEIIRQIFVIGIPIFGNMLAIVAMLYMHNIQSIYYGNVEGLAAYTMIAGLESGGSLLLAGLAAGIQPLAAYFYGANDYVRQNKMGNWGYYAAFAIGCILWFFSYAMRNAMPQLCGLSGGTATLAIHGLLISSTAFPLLGVLKVAAYYYQSTGKILYSSLLIYGDSFVALPICLFGLPLLFGMDGVWAAMPVSRAMLFAFLLYIWFCKGHKFENRKNTTYKKASIKLD